MAVIILEDQQPESDENFFLSIEETGETVEVLILNDDGMYNCGNLLEKLTFYYLLQMIRHSILRGILLWCVVIQLHFLSHLDLV